MKSLRQLIRQPLKTLSGILLVALAVSVLCVSFSQTLAAEDTVAKLKENFITVALPSDINTPDADAWADRTVVERTDIFQSRAQFGLASAYIPALIQDNYTNHLEYWDQMTNNSDYEPEHPVYSGAVLEITVTDIEDGYRAYEHYRVASGSQGNYTTLEEIYPEMDCYAVRVRGTIDRVLALEEGYHDPTGYSITLYLRVESEEAFNELALTEGERYLVYSDNYLDLDWQYRSYMMSSGKILFWEEGVEVPYWRSYTSEETTTIDWDSYNYFTQQYPDEQYTPEDFRVTTVTYKAKLGDLYTGITGNEVYMFRTIEMIIEDRSQLEVWEWETDGDGELVSGGAVEEYTYTDAQGGTYTMSLEEYRERYSIPTIVRLDGTAEEFLESEAGAAWQQVLSDIEINSHAFPVIGVDDLHQFADFACGRAKIAQGRHFTAEELASGAKVCIISESMAHANGLTVGDTISAQFMNYDFANPYQERIADGKGYVYPTAYSYYGKTMSLNEAESYTIVGLYHQYEPWGRSDNNLYSFTPNTIFAPKASVSGDMDYSGHGLFTTYVIDGDMLRQLQVLSAEAGFGDAFSYYDNGYTKLADSLKGYTQAAQEVLPLGILVYGVLMALYLMLFPGRQGRELTMMDSLGAPLWPRIRHILMSCLGILIPGSIIGAAAGTALWEYVSGALGSYMNAGVEIILDTTQLWAVSAVQAVLVAAAAALLGMVMALNTNYMKRK